MQLSQARVMIGVTVVTVFVVVLHLLGVLRPLENLLRSIVNKGSQGLYELSVSIGEEQELFASVEELEQAYIDVKQQLLTIDVDQTQLTLLEEENAELRRRLNYMTSSTFQTVGADIIGKNIEPLANTVVINQGAQAGIAEGNPVIIGDGILVGKISRVEKDTAIVRLITDSQSRIGAGIANRDKSLGIIEGGYAISVRMTFIPQNEVVSVGDAVITSGLEDGIPRGLYIGSIQSIQKETYQSFQEAVVDPGANIDKLHTVGVLIAN